MERVWAPGAGGPLRGRPVLVIRGDALSPIVRAGAVRAGGASVVVLSEPDPAELGLVDERIDVVVAVASAGTVVGLLGSALERGGRALPVLGLPAGSGGPTSETIELLTDPRLVDLDVAVPLVEDDLRAGLWHPLLAAGVEERHHLVEVDGRPAVAELHSRGLPISDVDLRALAAGAAGVLAGRMAAASRAWRRPPGG